MKRYILMLALLAGCANDLHTGTTHAAPYGLLNQAEEKQDNVKYQVSWGNVILGAVLFETVIAPIYVFGFNLWEPVALKSVSVGPVEKLDGGN